MAADRAWRRAAAALLLGLALALAGCQTPRAYAPDGFAPYPERWPFRAVSPDGVVFRARTEANEPRADLAFWQEALKRRMVEAGYRVTGEGALAAADGAEGYLLEMAAPVGQVDYAYLVGVFERGGELVIVEVAGEATRLEERRQAIRAAIDRLEL